MTEPSSYSLFPFTCSLLPAHILNPPLPFWSPIATAFCVVDLNTFKLRITGKQDINQKKTTIMVTIELF